ncbi:hypothetical protein [Gordonia sp. SL306]|uniref:hypothetical protein n=1 Tax=Gordonia sp. SL306 TaxID=2995145 RepID=UPI0022700EEF|nr:hypothetical protein [Gordonia sp. SL306]WAC54263.1 hypothetical protein OVA31_16420 [Gordonia sp. SL306]
MSEPQASALGWEPVSRALDAVAQQLDPIVGAATVIRADPDTTALVVALVSYAANWAQRADPDVSPAELATAMRATAGTIREVESLGIEGP